MSQDLLEAVRNQDRLIDIAYFLDYESADINYKDEHGITALMEAVINLDVVSTKFLLGRQALVDLVDKENKTALNHACESYNGRNEGPFLSVIALLLESGANPNHDYGNGEPLLDWTASNDHIEIAIHILNVHDYTIDELWVALQLAESPDMKQLLDDKIETIVSATENAETKTSLSVNSTFFYNNGVGLQSVSHAFTSSELDQSDQQAALWF